MNDLDALLPDIIRGDRRAFGRWASQTERTLRVSIRGFAHHVDTEAVVQETLLRVWQIAPKVQSDGKGNSLLRLAVTIARNRARDEAKRKGVKDIPPEIHAPPTPCPPDPMLGRAIQYCLNKLKGKPAKAMRSRLQSEVGDADRTLAEELNMTLNTFLKNIGRAREQLVICLKRRGVDLDEEMP
jgi:RNA polymerase sigma factor (sigma-70 family)